MTGKQIDYHIRTGAPVIYKGQIYIAWGWQRMRRFSGEEVITSVWLSPPDSKSMFTALLSEVEEIKGAE